MSDSESAPGPRRSQRERKQVIHFTSGASLPRSFWCMQPHVTIPSAQVRLRRESATGLIVMMEVMNTKKDTSPLTRTMSRLRMKTNKRIIALKSLGVKLLGHPRGRASRTHPNARASSRLLTAGRPPFESQKSLRLMATRQLRTKCPKTSKSTQTTRSSVRVDYPSCHAPLTHTLVQDAIMNPSAALQSTVEDFLDSLKETPGAAQAELVNCILRACGCNETVNEDEAVDYDGVVDALDNFTEALKQVR
jgi:cohesin complex subunit SA-1/2